MAGFATDAVTRIQVTSQGADPTADGDERAIIVTGVAADDVDELVVVVGDQQRVSRSGPRGAFTATLPPREGDIVLTAHRSDGTHNTLTLPPAANLDDLNRRLRNGQIPRHQPGGP
ncbi:MAG: hypothetical protein M3401_05865 [Actinomycetota bacterium]|nr:hypothetical protein [Actinomycetota bacterium]